MTAPQREAATVFGEVLRIPALRSLQIAYFGSLVSVWSFAIASAVYAFDIGGAGLVGALVLAKTVPAALAAPLLATLADRYSRRRVLFTANGSRALLMAAAAAAVALELPPAAVFILSGVIVLVSTAFEPAKNALIPELTPDARQLTAANAVTNTIESTSSSLGPAFAGGLLLLASVPVAFGLAAVLMLATLVPLSKLPEAPAVEPAAAPERLRSELREGLRAVAGDPRLRLLMGLTGAQFLISGMLSVFIVLLALDVLELGEGGVGLLEAALGVGGVIGGWVALAVARSGRLAKPLGIGLILWGFPIVVIGVALGPVVAVAMLIVVGVGNTLFDVADITLLQRIAPEHVQGRVFGVLEGLAWGATGIGGALAPVAIELLGDRGALIVAGLILPGLALVSWPRVARLDDSMPAGEEVALLAGVPFLSMLDPPALEGLASVAGRTRLAAGSQIVGQGEVGDRFFVVADGQVEVLEDGAPVRTEGPGDYFGEVALALEVPRTATVRALTEVDLLTLDREAFLSALAGNPGAKAHAESVARIRVGSTLRGLPRF